MVEVPGAAKKETAMPAPTTADPFRALRNEMDRLFDRFAGGFHLPSWRGMFGVEPAGQQAGFSFSAPAVDVSEDEKGYKITAELPGISEKDVDVTVTADGVLVIKGEKRQEKEEKDKNHYVAERAYGSFQRCFALPDSVDRDKITADLAKGVLTVTLPKKTEAQKPEQKIEVKAAA